MARPKRPDLSDLFSKTEPAAEPETERIPAPAKDRLVSVGLGLRLSELARLDAEAERRGMSRNALLREIVGNALQGMA